MNDLLKYNCLFFLTAPRFWGSADVTRKNGKVEWLFWVCPDFRPLGFNRKITIIKNPNTYWVNVSEKLNKEQELEL